MGGGNTPEIVINQGKGFVPSRQIAALRANQQVGQAHGCLASSKSNCTDINVTLRSPPHHISEPLTGRLPLCYYPEMKLTAWAPRPDLEL